MGTSHKYLLSVVFLTFVSGVSFAQDKTEIIKFGKTDLDKTNAVKKLRATIKNRKIFKIITKDIIPENGNSADGDSSDESSKWDFDSITVDNFSSDIQSVEMIVENYMGPSGSTNFNNFTFNVKTGQIYSLSDLFQPNTDWAHLIWPYVQKALASERPLDPGERSSDGYKSFHLDRTTLYLDFDFCELLPCQAARTYTIPVPLKEIKNFLRLPFQHGSK